MESFKKVNAALASEFDMYLLEHSEIAEQIPQNALIVFQIEGNTEFNRWAMQLAEKNQENNQPIILVKIKGLRPVVSRLIEPKLEPVTL
ncbi:MAG: DUF5647 family protein [Candidatus Edwardsbacteria bacterium]